MATTHTVANGFCTTCGETEDWLRQHSETVAAAVQEEGILMGGVRNDDAHTLRVDRLLSYGVREERHFWCTCGADFGRVYDAPARKAYRAHRAA